MSTTHGGFGWVKDSEDHRDFLFSAPPKIEIPNLIDLRHEKGPSGSVAMPAVYNQGQLGSCTANALAALFQYQARMQGERMSVPSRLFIYFEERRIEGSIGTDSGAMLRDGMKVLNNVGAPPEVDWPYLAGRFAEQPPRKAYLDAAKHKSITYSRVTQNVQAIRTALANKFALVFGFAVYASFESDVVLRTGVVPMPDLDAEELLGYHAVLLCGADHIRKEFICRNSWSARWGDHGYFHMPYSYVTDRDLASDFWTLKKET